MLSQRALSLKSSPTLALVAKARDLTMKGHDVISLTVGEPDWPTYPEAAQAGIQAIQNGFTKYTAAQGTIELRQAIARRTEEDLGLKYSPQKEITVTSGAKFSIFTALQVLCDPQDEVIIHSPYWVSYPAMAELAGAKPRIVTCEADVHFKLTAENLEKNINQNTKVFLFCSPSNPTGFIYFEKELRALADVLLKYPRIHIISDDMYNRLMFNKVKVAPHLLQVAPELRDRTVVINGGSKAYAMTGWRMGWAIGPEKIIKAIGDFSSQATGAPSSISQKAAEAALMHSEERIVQTNQMLKERLESALVKFKQIPTFQVYIPDGAFYFWIDIRKALGKKYQGVAVDSSARFCEILLEQYFVATVPGEEFGHPGYVRLSFAIESKRFDQAMDRVIEMMASFS